MTKQQIAYLAGMIDGEGCIHIHRPSNSHRPRARVRLQVSQKKREVLDVLAARAGVGKVYRIVPKGKGRTPTHVWVVNRQRDVWPLLDLVEPYLIVKRDRLREARGFATDVIQ